MTYTQPVRTFAAATLFVCASFMGFNAMATQIPLLVHSDHRADPEAARPLASLRTSGAVTKPYMSDQFADSFGINTRFNERLYSRQQDAAVHLLVDLGFRHIRDGNVRDDANARAFLQSLCTKHGIHSSLGLSDTDKDADILQYGRDVRCIDMVEGPNELNGQPNWVPRLATFMPHVYSFVRSSSEFKNIPIVAPSITKLEDSRLLADHIDLAQYVDLGNKHSYPGQRNIGGADGTGAKGWGARLEPCPKYTYGSFFFDICASQVFTNDRPIWTTETGYASSPDGAPPSASHPGGMIPYDVAAKYLPRLMAYEFANGIPRTYVMALLDGESGCTGAFSALGLVAQDCLQTDPPASLRPKPPFFALKNLMKLVSDPGPSFVPQALTLIISSPNPRLQTLLLQKRNHEYILVYWIEASDWDVDAATRIDVTPERIDVAFGDTFEPTGGRLVHIDDTGSATPVTSVPFRNGRASIEATDELHFFMFHRRQ